MSLTENEEINRTTLHSELEKLSGTGKKNVQKMLLTHSDGNGVTPG